MEISLSTEENYGRNVRGSVKKRERLLCLSVCSKKIEKTMKMGRVKDRQELCGYFKWPREIFLE